MRLTGIVGLVALAAGTSLAQGFEQDFPDWRTPETVERTRWRTPSLDTLDWSVLADSSAPGSGRDSLVWVSVRFHKLLTAMMWPIEKVMTPVGRLALDPLEAPTLYAEQTEVIERGVRLVQLDSAGMVMLYPTMVMDGGAGSRLGGTFIHRTLLGNGSYARLGGALMINHDWYGSLSLSAPPWGSRRIQPNLRLSGGRSSNSSVWIPGEIPIGSGIAAPSIGESRQNAEVGLSFPLGPLGGAEALLRTSRRVVGEPTRKADMLDTLPDIPWFEHGDRGMAGGEERWLQTGFVWGKNTTNLEGTPSEGGSQSLAIFRSFDEGGGDAVLLNLDMTRFLLIGDERYAYRKGDLDPYLKLSPSTILTLLDPTTLRQRLTQRRILALQLTARRMWEMEPHRDPVSYFHFPAYGGDAPARAYGGRRIMDHAVMGGSLEYRWPIWRYIDGSAFAELAWAGEDWWDVNNTGLAPGWGFGLRIRTPRQFLFRGQLAWGLEGMRALVTVSPEF